MLALYGVNHEKRPFATILAFVVVLLFALTGGSLAQSGSATFAVTSDWTSGFQCSMTVSNTGATTIAGFQVEFDFPHLITSNWDSSMVALGANRYAFTGPSWNLDLAPGGSATFGFVATSTAARNDPTNATLNGTPIPMNGAPSGATPGGGGGSNPGPGPVNPLLPTVPAVGSGKRIVGYFTAWSIYGRNYHVANIPADKITHINYAFANLSNGQVVRGDPYADTDKFYPGDSWAAGALRGNFNQLNILKNQNPHLKTLISIGGWTWSSGFSTAAATPTSRALLANSAVQFMKQYGFDGIDLDWEYPVSGGLSSNVTSASDKQNFTLLLAELRSQLDALEAIDRRHYLLTIASSAGPATYANIEISLIHQYLDWINVMAYDFHGSWSPITHFNSALYPQPNDPTTDPVILNGFNGDVAIQAYLNAGVPPHKLVLGAGYYGRGWEGVPNVNNGLYQPHTGVPSGSWEPGVFDYKDLAQNYLGNGYTRYWDNDAKVPYIYNPATGIMVSYDDDQSLGVKADYVNNNGLGGIMFWEFSGDDATSTLSNKLHDKLVKNKVYLDMFTTGAGTGDLRTHIDGVPPTSTHAILLMSATPAPVGIGTGGFAGLVYDSLTAWSLNQPSTPFNPIHFPLEYNPYDFGPIWQGPGYATALAGQVWEFCAVSYSLPLTITGFSPVVQVVW